MHEPGDITKLLALARGGDRVAENDLFEIVYSELRGRAHRMLRGETSSSSFSSGELVNEAFIKLFRSGSRLIVQDRVHFYLLAARAMRQVIVDHARKRVAAKRGKGTPDLEFDEFGSQQILSEPTIENVIAVSEVCERLADSRPELAQVIDLRFFSGLRIVEIAELLCVSEVTIDNRLKRATSFLLREMNGGSSAPVAER